MPLLEVRNLHVTYVTRVQRRETEVPALTGLSLSLSDGERYCLIGGIGAGKTTLMKTILGLLPESARVRGEVIFEGENLLRLSPEELRLYRWRRISVVFESGSYLNPNMTVAEQLGEVLDLHSPGLSLSDKARIIREALAKVGLDPLIALRYPHELSEGQKRRVLIAMALLTEPKLLIVDNPIAGLDYVLARQIVELIKFFCKERVATALLMFDDIRWAAELGERTGIIHAGRIVEEAETGELFERPTHPVTKILIATARTFESWWSVEWRAHATEGCQFAPQCPLAEERCYEQAPPSIEVAPGHRVACWKARELVGVSPEEFLRQFAI